MVQFLHHILSFLLKLLFMYHLILLQYHNHHISHILLTFLVKVDPQNIHLYIKYFIYLWISQILKLAPHLTHVLLPINFYNKISSLNVRFKTPSIGNFSTYLSNCPLVLGNPSKSTPFLDYGSFTFSLMIFTTI